MMEMRPRRFMMTAVVNCSNSSKLSKNIKRGVISEVIKGTEYTSYKVWKYDMRPDSPRTCILNFFLTAMCAESFDDISKRAENGEDWVALRHELLY